MTATLAIILVSLLLSAFFSGMEIAYVASNKIHIEIEKKQDGLLANILGKLTSSPSRFITTMLVGNNIALVIYGIYMGRLLIDLLYPEYRDVSFLPFRIILIQTLISTGVIVITAEFLPKVIFQIYANTLLKFFAIPAYGFIVLFSAVSSFVIRLSDFLLRVLFKTSGDQVQQAFTKTELGDYISERVDGSHEEEELDTEIQIFQNALEFSEVKAREVMVPRTEITAVELHESPKSLIKLFTDTGFSKILIYKDTIDDIIGYVHSFELFKKPRTLKSVMMPVEYVPETMLINDVLEQLTKKRKSIAVVLDEYGGTSGMITVEDIVEELFGEIEDEHDTTDLEEVQLSENEYRFSARLEVDYINEEYKLDLPESENYETLGGLVVSHLEEIPLKGEEFRIGRFKFTVLEVSHTKIDLLQLRVFEEE